MSELLKERYRKIKLIGQGGFGKTFLAVDCDKPSKPPCVIKQFSPSSQGTNSLEKAEELFNKEAARLENLGKHPQIPELLAHFEQEQQLYLIQEYIDGQNLAEDLAENGVWDETAIKELLIGLLPVLQFVHDNNLIHRDIKPENIIQKSEDKTFVLVDFGAARYVTGTALLKTGTIIGDPRYMSDEQLRGKTVFSSDLYSLGLTCLHLLTNIYPWDLYDGHEGEFIWRNYLREPIDEALGEILDKMIEKPIKNRFQNAQEILSILQPSQTQINPSLDLSKPAESVSLEEENKETETDITVDEMPITKTDPVIDIDLTPIKLGDLWGYIDAKGKVVIEPRFEEAETFIDGLAKVRIDRKYGYIDKYGKIIIQPKFDEIGHFIDGLAKVRIDRKYGYMDQSKTIVIQPNYDETGHFIDGLAKVKINGKYGYIDKKGNIVIKPRFDEIERFIDGLAKVKINRKYGYIDKKDNVIIEAWFDSIETFLDDLAIICIDGEYGYIDKKSNIVIQPKFDEIGNFSKGLAKIKLYGKYGYIDKKGTIVIEPKFDEIGTFSEGLAKIRIGRSHDGKYGYVDKKGTIVIDPKFDEIGTFSEGLAKIRIGSLHEGKYGYIDKKGTIVIEPKFDQIGTFSNNLAIIRVGEQYGLINKKGTIVIERKFNKIRNFSGDLAIVYVHNKCGLIDQKGTIIIEPKFHEIGNFSEGLARIEIREYLDFPSYRSKYGFIDQKGKIVIKPKFNKAEDFKNGQAYVEKEGFFGLRKGYIDKKGKWIKLTEEELKIEIAIMLYQKEEITLGKASELAKVNQLQFQHLLASREIPINYDIDDLETDLKNLASLEE
ncbi:WG repeat-containing protein [Crocosphaera sp.]|uniref:WG repeat-containing protein n=1 Tax=Crocosphaera sp. TaxID=2729996 RepID=UPI00262A71D6|nr:WG repeat-containing protein [Crocosphaera sp.]MDJ0580920.1 WG repeat-containing protein [Crocosphaera sp.]